MNEHTTLEKIAPNVEEAIAQGLAELGLDKDAVDVEVLDEGSRGLLGIGGRQARVRLTVKLAQPNPRLALLTETGKTPGRRACPGRRRRRTHRSRFQRPG